MRHTYVRGHYRRRRRPHKSNGSAFLLGLLLFLLLLGGVPLLIHAFSSIPLQVYLVALVFLLCALVAFFLGKHRYMQHLRQAEAQHQLMLQQQEQQHQERMHLLQVQRECEQWERMKSLGDVLMLSDSEFEYFVGKLLSAFGYTEVKRVGGRGDLAADITAVDPQGRDTIVQCKHYAPGRLIGTPELQKFVGMMAVHHKVYKGIFVTTSGYTQDAQSFAKVHQAMLQTVNGEQLLQWIQRVQQSAMQQES